MVYVVRLQKYKLIARLVTAYKKPPDPTSIFCTQIAKKPNTIIGL